MFEALSARAAALVEARAEKRRDEIAAALPGAAVEGEAVVVSGRGVRRRLALDGSLAAMIAGALK